MRSLRYGLITVLLAMGCQPAPVPTVVPRQPVNAAASLAIMPVGHLAWGPDDCDGRLLNHQFFVICYASGWKLARWTAYRLEPGDLEGKAPRIERFRPDPLLASSERAELSDYRNSGFDRGHLAPADDFVRSPEAIDATFVLSNMVPQDPSLNRGRWRVLESEVHTLASRSLTTWIITGPIFMSPDSQPVGPERYLAVDRVAIPTHLFKMVLQITTTGERQVFAFVFPNQGALPGPSLSYSVSVDQVERWTGIDFFSRLPDDEEVVLEARVADKWPHPE